MPQQDFSAFLQGQDFSTFVGAWALLLTCIVLVIEPLAHGARWFNRGLRLALGVASLATFFLAYRMWQDMRIASPEELHDIPRGWTPFSSLTEAFLAMWGLTAAVAVPAMAPAAAYRRMRRLLAVGPLVTAMVLAVVLVGSTLGPERPGPVENILATVMSFILVCSMTVSARWFLQSRFDGVSQTLLAVRQTKIARALRHKLLRDDPAA